MKSGCLYTHYVFLCIFYTFLENILVLFGDKLVPLQRKRQSVWILSLTHYYIIGNEKSSAHGWFFHI